MEYQEFSDLIFIYVKEGGPLIGIIFPIIETFFPFLPLVLFVIINVSVFGLFWGYLYSWIGNCVGSFLLFLFLRKVGRKKIEKIILKSKYAATLEKIKRKNTTVMFFLYCFPFTPSFLISGAAALANMNTTKFSLTLLPAKLIMMISLSFIGQNVSSFFKNPIKSIIYITIIFLFNFLSKRLVHYFELKHKDLI